MSVHFSDGIGFSAKAGGATAMYIVDDAKTNSLPPVTETITSDWSPWGSNNDLPRQFADDIENAGVLNAALEAKSRIAIGKGLRPFLLKGVEPDGKEILEFLFDNEILDWLELNDIDNYCFDKAYDRNAYGWNVSKILFNKAGNYINRLRRHDVYECRLAKKDSRLKIPHIYLSADWSLAPSAFDATRMARIPLLQDGYEIDALKNKGNQYEFALANRRIRDGRQYYSMPLWYAAKLWVNVARKVPITKKAMFENQMQLKYMIYISADYFKRIHKDWDNYTPEKRTQLYKDKADEIDTWLTGADKWFKSTTSMKYRNAVTGELEEDIDVKIIDDKLKDGALLPDSTAANSEIIFSMMMNPALMGNGQPGGPYSNNAGGSNVRESYLVQLMLMEAERKEIARELGIVAEINGWAKTYNQDKQRLVWRFPSGLLTTLDTGKSTKPEVL